MMDWNNLLEAERLGDPAYKEEDDRPAYVQDIDRIIFSAPFRRLANKTQVHPLYENDNIHHRLIHSIETASVGRSLGMMAGNTVKERLEDSEYPKDIQHRIAGTVQAACLAHDIGNPPFGHSGEETIKEWFEEKKNKSHAIIDSLDDEKRADFTEFDGNAQGFRILTRLEMYRGNGGMRLSYATLGAFMKYPATAAMLGKAPKHYKNSCAGKKAGVFSSEERIAREICAKLKTGGGGKNEVRLPFRHPLVFLMEAADDITYHILDIEDAFVANDISIDEAKEALLPIGRKGWKDLRGTNDAERMAHLRAISVNNAISAASDAFRGRYDCIMKGSLSQSLIEISTIHEEFQELSRMAKSRLYTAQRKTSLETLGRNATRIILDSLFELIARLYEAGWRVDDLGSYHTTMQRALGFNVEGICDCHDALHRITDYVSGMTDRYAVQTARMLSGAT